MPNRSANINELLQSAREYEREGDLSEAEAFYLKVVKNEALNATAYNRLMIIYRKQKQYNKELAVINKAIKAYETAFKAEQQAWSRANRKAARLSKTLAEQLGLIDKKGLPVYEDKVVAAWRKRKQTVGDKLGRGKDRQGR